MNWRPKPFVRLLMPLILGIVLQEKLQLKEIPQLMGLVFGISLLTILLLSRIRIKRKFRWVFGIFVNVALICFGSGLHFFHQENNRPDHFSEYTKQKVDFSAVIKKITAKGKNIQAILSISQMGSDSLITANGQLLAYIPIDSNSQNLEIGDAIYAQSYIAAPEIPKNPQAFNYARYLHNQNIHFTTFIRPENWRKMDQNRTFSILSLSHKIQKRCLQILQKHLPSDRERSVASALILGYKPDLSQEIKSAYSDSGAMHVLAVSGLHTGFIYMIVMFFLNKIPVELKSWPAIKTVLLILSLWLFALITGAAPSVLRSATMFSFVALGKAINRESNIYNTLAASAFCLLLTDPFLIFAPGFQLSYLAVSGIVYFQPLIYKLWYLPNKVPEYFWQLTSVSIAAQLSTFPLSLYYFHKIPTYFWLSGMVVIPAAALILPLGLLLFAMDQIPFLGWAIGKILYYIVWLMNQMILFIQQLPGAILTNSWIGPLELIIISGSLLTFIFVLEKKSAEGMMTLGILLLVLSGFSSIKSWNHLNQQNITIYHQKKGLIMDCIYGQEAYTVSTFNRDSPEVQFSIIGHQQFRSIKNSHFVCLDSLAISFEHIRSHDGYIQFLEKHIFVLGHKTVLPAQKTTVEILILTGNPSISMDAIIEQLEFSTLVIDATNHYQSRQKWIDYCSKSNLAYWDIHQNGAFTLDF